MNEAKIGKSTKTLKWIWRPANKKLRKKMRGGAFDTYLETVIDAVRHGFEISSDDISSLEDIINTCNASNTLIEAENEDSDD